MKLFSKLTILLLAFFLVLGASCTAKEKKVKQAEVASEPVDEEAIRIASIVVSQLPEEMHDAILGNMEAFKADLARVLEEDSRFFIIADKSHLLLQTITRGSWSLWTGKGSG